MKPSIEIWVDASYTRPDRKMGAGWVTVLFNGDVQERSRPLSAENAGSTVAEYLAAIMVLQMQGTEKRIELFSDCLHVVKDINAAKSCFVSSGKIKDLRNILRAVAGSRDVTATYASEKQAKHIARAHDLATLGRLGETIGQYHPVSGL